MKNNLLTSFLITAFLFIYSSFLFTPGFETNDDVGMMRIASGLYTGKPSEYLVYTNVILGKILKTLYTWDQNIDWYSVYLYSIHFLSMWFLLNSLLRLRKLNRLYGVLFFLLLFAVFELRFLIRVQFTTTSAVAGVSGIILLVSESMNNKNSIVLNIIGILFIVISYLCRPHALYLVTIPFLPFIIFHAFQKRSRLLIGSLALAALLCTLLEKYHRYVYLSDQGWNAFTEYNLYRSQLHGFPILRELYENDADLTELAWTQNDLMMLRMWYYTDNDKYSMSNLKSLIEIYNGYNFTYNGAENSKSTYDYLIDHYVKIRKYALFLVSVTLIFIVSRLTTPRVNKIICATFTISMLLLIYLCFKGRIVERVSLPVLYTSCSVLFIMILTRLDHLNEKIHNIYYSFSYYMKFSFRLLRKDEEEKSLVETSVDQLINRSIVLPVRSIPLFYLVYLVASTLSSQVENAEYLSKQNIYREEKYENLLKGYEVIFQEMEFDPTLVSWGGYIPLGWQQPFKKYPILKDLNIINLGWATHSPNYEESLERSNITNIDLDLLGRNDIFLCCHQDMIEFYKIYMNENYGYDITVESIGEEVFSNYNHVKVDMTNIFRIYIDNYISENEQTSTN